MESPLNPTPSYPKISKQQILDIFKTSCPKSESILYLADFLSDIFSNDIIEPENFQQQPEDFNIADAILENTATPKPMRLVTQKRVTIPKSPFSSSGYADDPTHRVWYYLDEGSNIQGPFTSFEMDFWFDSGFFFNELLIRIKENNDFVKLIHLFGKTELIQVYKPALLTPMGHMLTDQAPLSSGIRTSEPMSSGPGPALEKKQSIYTFGFDADDAPPSPGPLKEIEKTLETSAETPTIKVNCEEDIKPVEADEAKQPSICVNNTDLAEKEGEKGKEEKYKEIKEVQEEINGHTKRNESNAQNNRNHLDVKVQKEEKNLLSPSGYKKNQRGPDSSKKRNSYVEVYEPKTSPCPDKSGSNGKQQQQQQDTRKNKTRDQTVLQYVVKGEKKEEPEPVKEKREKNNNNNNSNKGGNQPKKNNDRDQALAGTPGKKAQDMVIFVPKKKAEVNYTEKAKDTPEKIYVPKQQQQHHKEANNNLHNLQPGFFQRKESDTFEILKATSEFYHTDTTNSISAAHEDSRQLLPPGLQPGAGFEPVMNGMNGLNGRSFQKKPKDNRLRLLAAQNHNQCDDYEKEQERVVATSLGLLDLEEDAIVNKKPPTKSLFKNNSATPSPLIIDNKTVGKLYNFNEDLKYSSFSNQATAESFPAEKEC